MKGLVAVLGLLLMLCYLGVALGAFALSIYGLVLAFQASIVLGILAFIFEPSPLLFGAVMFFFGKNIPEMILQWLGN